MQTFWQFIESYTISVPEQEQKFHTISDLANAINSQIQKAFNVQSTGYPTSNVDIDGFDVSAKNGIINFYVTDNIPKNKIANIVKAISYYIIEFGWKQGQIKNDMSKMFNIPTYRFPVATESQETKQEINISNDNLSKLFNDILNYSSEEFDDIVESGQINVRDLKIKLNSYINIDKHTEDPKQDKNFYSFGTTKEQLERYISVLDKLCDLALENGEDYLTIS